MKVLFVTNLQPTRRRPTQGIILRRTADALRQAGVSVEIVPFTDRGGIWRYWSIRRDVQRLLHSVTPDIIHVHFGYSGLAVPSTAVPIITTFNGDDLNGTPNASGSVTWRSRAGILVSQMTALRSRRIIVVSEDLKAKVWSRAARARVRVVRDAVDPDLFRPLSQVEARERLGLSTDRLLVLYPHDVTQPTKRFWLAEAAVQLLRATIPHAELWVVNDAAPDDMPWYYAAADVMIVTSRYEGGPATVKEALACGLPVVSVPVGDTRVFSEVGAGAYLSAPEPQALAASLEECLRHAPATRSSLLPGHLTLRSAARQILEIYREAVGRSAQDRSDQIIASRSNPYP